MNEEIMGLSKKYDIKRVNHEERNTSSYVGEEGKNEDIEMHRCQISRKIEFISNFANTP